MVYKTPAQARKMIRALDLPNDLHQVQKRRFYRCEAFLDLFIECCETVVFHAPRDGLPMAETAVQIAEEIDHCNADLKVRALAVLAGTHRQLRDFPAAEQLYQRALSMSVEKLTRAFLYCRISVLRNKQKRLSEALELTEEAIGIYQQHAENSSQFGIGFFYRAVAHLEAKDYDAAFLDFSRSLAYLNPKEHETAHYCAMHNLALVVGLAAVSLDDLNAALKRLHNARKLIKTGLKSVPRLKLRWLEGVILAKIGSENLAESVFITARKGFLKLGAVAEAAYTALDLGVLLYNDQRWDELEALAVESHALLKSKSADDEALAALLLWIEAVRARTFDHKIVDQVRARLLKQRVGS